MKKLYLLTDSLGMEVTPSSHIPLVRTNHMATPKCRECTYNSYLACSCFPVATFWNFYERGRMHFDGQLHASSIIDKPIIICIFFALICAVLEERF